MPLDSSPWPPHDPGRFCHTVHIGWFRCRFIVWPPAADEPGYLEIDWFPRALICMSAEEFEQCKQGRRRAEEYASVHAIDISEVHISEDAAL